MILELKRAPGVYLVGFMGSGKTTVGRLLSSHIGWFFADIDSDIEAEQHATITEIFETRGEQEFRRLEAEAIERRVRKISCGRPTIVALGGGAFSQPGNFDLISRHGISIWLDLPLAILEERVRHSAHRPLARDPERFKELYNARRGAYARASYRVEVPVNDSSYAVARIIELGLF